MNMLRSRGRTPQARAPRRNRETSLEGQRARRLELALVVLGSISLTVLASGVAWRGLPWPAVLPLPPLARMAVLTAIPLLYLFLGLRLLAAGRSARVGIEELTLQKGRERAQEVERELKLVLQCSSAATRLVSPRTREELAERVCRIGREILGGEQVSVMLYEPDSEQLTVVAAAGHSDPSRLVNIQQNPGDGIAGWVAEHRRPLLLGPDMDPKKFWRFKPKPEVIHAAMIVPLLHRDRLLGVVNVSRRATGRTYRKEDLRALQSIAWSASLCLRLLEATGGDAESEAPRQAS